MKTMDEVYGDGSSHECCDRCGYCIECGDCHCKDVNEIAQSNKQNKNNDNLHIKGIAQKDKGDEK